MSKEAIALLVEYCEWCNAQGGDCQAHLDGCNVFEALAILKQPKDQQLKALDFAINCGAMGKGDDSCCGCIYWSSDGKLFCNECGTEYYLVEKEPSSEFTEKIRHNLRAQSRAGDTHRLGNIYAELLKKACDRLDTSEASRKELLTALEEAADDFYYIHQHPEDAHTDSYNFMEKAKQAAKQS